MKSLQVLPEASRYRSDHSPLILHLDCQTSCNTHTHHSSAASNAKIKYDVQKAEAYQVSLASELQQHFIPLTRQELDVDVLCDKLETRLKSAAQETMPQACKRQGVHSRKQQPWFDISCKEALVQKNAVYKNPHSPAAEKNVAEKKFRSVTDRVKEAWTKQRNAELCEMSARDPSRFWKAFSTQQRMPSLRPSEL